MVVALPAEILADPPPYLRVASKPLKFDTDIVVGAAEAPPGAIAAPGLQLVVRLLGRLELGPELV